MGHVPEKLLQTLPRDIAIPAIVLFELEVGLAKSQEPDKRRNQLEALVDMITVIPFAEEEAKSAAHIRAALESLGTPIGAMDVLIAGTALANQHTLVTHNTKEFERIAGLSLEDWF